METLLSCKIVQGASFRYIYSIFDVRTAGVGGEPEEALFVFVIGDGSTNRLSETSNVESPSGGII